MITPKLADRIELRSVDALIPYARNARTHSEEQIARIAASIAEFGFTNPILVDGDNGIIAGHGRLAAARKLGLKEVPVIELAHLSPAQKRAYILADNRLAEMAGWDGELLKIELDELQAEGFDLDLIGFDEQALADLLGEEEPNRQGQTDDDAVPEAPEEPVTQPGDVVLDPFGGSGTTLIAAEKTGRRARLIELEPKYCDVIVRRWQDYTGGQARRRSG